jgi:glutaminase
VAALVQQYLDRIRAEHAEVNDGALASYIPELTRVDPNAFGLSLSSGDGYVYASGDAAVEFTIQSISKPFTYALALDRIGQDAVDARIGVEPSGEAFNEISVDRTTKTPKNPMINAGAIAAVSLIPASTPGERFALIQDFYSAFAGRRLELDAEVYASEKASGSRNRAIAYMLQSFGVLDDDPDDVLDVYFRQCSFNVTATDLARMAATLARGRRQPDDRAPGHQCRRGETHAVGDGDVRDVRRRWRLGERRRHACQERRRRRHRRGAARPTRDRRLLAPAGRKGQQRAGSSGVPQHVRATGVALPQRVARLPRVAAGGVRAVPQRPRLRDTRRPAVLRR